MDVEHDRAADLRHDLILKYARWSSLVCLGLAVPYRELSEAWDAYYKARDAWLIYNGGK